MNHRAELRSCVKVEVAVLGSLSPNSPYGLRGRKATFEEEEEEEGRRVSKLKSCVKVVVVILGSPSPNSPYGLCGRKATVELKKKNGGECQSSGVV